MVSMCWLEGATGKGWQSRLHRLIEEAVAEGLRSLGAVYAWTSIRWPTGLEVFRIRISMS